MSDMTFRQITGTGDWIWGQGASGYAFGNAAIALNIQTIVLSWVGDCFWALGDGIDWRARLDVGQQQDLISELTSRILQAYGVVGVTSVNFLFNPKTRGLTVTYMIDTIYSSGFQAVINGTAGIPQGV